MRQEERLLHLGSLLVLLGLPLACSTRLADAVEVPKSAVYLAGGLTLAFAWVWGAARGSWPWFRPNPLTAWWVALYGWWASSSLWGQGGLAGHVPTTEHLVSLLVLLAWTATGTPDRWRLWWGMILAAGLVVTIYAWMQRLGLDPMLWSHPEISRIRTISTMGNSNYLALYMVAWLALSLPSIFASGRSWLWIPWLMTWMALVQTGTRGAWIGCLVSLIAAVVILRNREVLGVALAMALGFLLVVSSGADLLRERAQVESLANKDVTARVYLWKAAFAILLAHPLGAGPGAFTPLALEYRMWEPVELRPLQRLPENPHSQLLSVGADCGWPGIILLLGGLVTFLRGRLAGCRQSSTELALLLAGLGLSAHLLTLNLALPTEAMWLAALSWPGQFCPAARMRPARVVVWLTGLVWLGGCWLAGGWIVGESRVWWADEARLQGFAALQQNQDARLLLTTAVRRYREALPLVQAQRRPEIEALQGLLYLELSQRVGGNRELDQEAMHALQRAEALDPGNPYYPDNQGLVARRLNGSGEAQHRRAIRLDPYNPAFWAHLGDDQRQRKLFEQAAESYRQSLQLYPDHSATLAIYGEVLNELGRRTEGEAALRRAQELRSSGKDR
ncbi:hypothetical protein DYH09_04905 [bacterium CPR1]|nr:hypothetical protein [bacterium CPR1]